MAVVGVGEAIALFSGLNSCKWQFASHCRCRALIVLHAPQGRVHIGALYFSKDIGPV